MSASLVFREPRPTAPASCFVSGTRGSFRNALQILIVCPTSRLPRKISTLPKYRAFWLLTECVYRRWRMKSAGIGETVRKRVLLTDPLSRQRVFKRLQFFTFENMIWKCETMVKLFVYTKMCIYKIYKNVYVKCTQKKY